MRWPFVKYAGCGNDFILFDNRKDLFPKDNKSLIKTLCHRQWGIGADGLILLESTARADFRMRIFNADGSEAEMCGNGIRCLVSWYHSLISSPQKSYTVETLHRLHQATVEGPNICIDMGVPTRIEWDVPITYQEKLLKFHFLSTGVPHAVLFHDDIDSIDLAQLGPFIRHHPYWGPGGTNVTLAQPIDATHFKMRAFERGVEGETLACGTGATAAALAAAYHLKGSSPLTIHMPAGNLQIGFSLSENIFSAVTMTGPAIPIFEGAIET